LYVSEVVLFFSNRVRKRVILAGERSLEDELSEALFYSNVQEVIEAVKKVFNELRKNTNDLVQIVKCEADGIEILIKVKEKEKRKK